MDLSVKSVLSESEHDRVAKDAQTAMLAGMVAEAEWRAEAWAFHGGSSLRLAGRSHRWSEDLDFMLSSDAAEDDRLDRVMERAAGHARKLLDRAYPRSEVTLKTPKRKPGRESAVSAYTLRWEHPMRQGAVKVKCELYATTPDALKNYETAPLTLSTPDGNAYEIPAGTPKAVWADKIAAFAGRPVVKWRDVFDLSVLEVDDVAEADAAEALAASFGVYGHDPEDALKGVEARVDDGVFADVEGFRADMRRWLPDMPEDEARDRLHRAREAVDRGAALMRERLLGAGPTP